MINTLETFHRSDVKRFMQLVHTHRNANTTESYWSTRDVLEGLIEDVLHGYNYWQQRALQQELCYDEVSEVPELSAKAKLILSLRKGN